MPNSSACGLELLAPLKQNSEGSWIDLNSNEIVDLNGMWFTGQPNGKDIQNCATFFASTGRFIDETCTYKSCSVCAWKNEPAFTLRGLKSCRCIDWYYVLLPDVTYNNNVFFLGFGRNNIIFSQELNSWLIVEDRMGDLFQPGIIEKKPTKIVGIFEPETYSNQMPIGMHIWNVTNCGGIIPLKLTPVSKTRLKK